VWPRKLFRNRRTDDRDRRLDALVVSSLLQEKNRRVGKEAGKRPFVPAARMALPTAFQREGERREKRSTIRVPSGLLDYQTPGSDLCREQNKIVQNGLIQQNAIGRSQPGQQRLEQPPRSGILGLASAM
jgi:hypothetical protein